MVQDLKIMFTEWVEVMEQELEVMLEVWKEFTDLDLD